MLYPNNIRKQTKGSITHKNRGLDLEKIINESNNYYLINDIAAIYKKPTPIGVVDVAYNNCKKLIKKAYFASKSTLDYNGVYKGKYLDFEAKETRNKTSFPLRNIHVHQIDHLNRIINCGGIAFLIIKMNNCIYLLKGEDFIEFIDKFNRKSIPYEYIKKKGYVIKECLNPALDYLKIIENIYFKECNLNEKEKSSTKK